MTCIALVIQADASLAISIPQALDVAGVVTTRDQLLLILQTLGAVLCPIQTTIAIIIYLLCLFSTETNAWVLYRFADYVQGVLDGHRRRKNLLSPFFCISILDWLGYKGHLRIVLKFS